MTEANDNIRHFDEFPYGDPPDEEIFQIALGLIEEVGEIVWPSSREKAARVGILAINR